MIEITLTEFVDFVIKSGSPKVTVVKNCKKRHQETYDPKTDFYKKLRDGIVDFHRRAQPKAALDALVHGIADKNKVVAYPILVAAYKRFLGRKNFAWFQPPKESWIHSTLSVTLNPELGVEIEGEPHLIKLYFKDQQPSKLQVNSILHLLHLELENKKQPRTIALLDIRRAKLITMGTPDPLLTPLVQGEALSFAQIYNAL
jgi:hypothetical protein